MAAASVAVVAWACSDPGTGPGIASSISVTPTQATLGLGETLQISVSLRDRDGRELPTSQITWTSSDMGTANVSGPGLVAALAVGGPVMIAAHAGSLTAQALVTVVAGGPAQLSITTQPSAAGTSGSALGRQPVVQVRDAGGNASPISAVEVTAVLAEGQGTLSNATATTDANGRATFTSLTISGASGAYRLRFEATGLTAATSDPVTLSAAASLAFAVQPPGTAQNGVPFATQPQIAVSSIGGAPVAGEPVTASVASGGGTLAGTTTVLTNASGVAVFTDLGLIGLVGDRTLRFTAGLFSVESDPIALEAGDVPASLLIVTQPPSAALNGVPFAQQPVVEVRDEAGNPIPGASLTATVASGAGTLGGTTTKVTNANGRVAFTGLSLTGPTGQYTLGFTSGTVSVQSDAIMLSVGTPSAIQIVTQPSATAQSGVVFAQQPRVDVRDSGDNPVVGVVVTASIATGGGALGGTATATTNASGRATFSSLSISGLVGNRTLGFTSGPAAATSGTIQLQAGPLAQLVITTQPSSNATNDAAFPQQPVVRASDAAGNGIASLDVVAVIQSGGGSLGGTTTASTNGSGVATFTNLKITGTVGPRTLRFAVGGVGVTSGTVNLSAGAPVGISILTQPPALAIDAVSFQQFARVELRDVSNNLVPGVDVVVSVASGAGTLSGATTVTTSGAGTATFSNLSISGSPGPRTLRFSSSGLQIVSSTVHVGYAQGGYIDLQYCGSIAAQRMDVYVPSNSFQRPLPVAVYIHGGSWTGHDKSEEDLLLWANARQELLGRGFVVATLNYRLATASANKWPAQIHDVKCAIRHLRAEAGDYGADGRIGVWGASAGGHLAAMIGVTDTIAAPHLEGSGGYAGWSSRVSAAVAIGGIFDLTQQPDHPEIQFEGGEWAFTEWPGPNSTQLNHASPLWWASSDDPPFLIVHGQEDGTVLYPQAPRMDDALDGAGASSTLVPVVNGGHELQNIGGTATPSILVVMEQIADFFDTHVR